MASNKDTLKSRRICFSNKRNQKQAEDAMDILKDVNSIESLSLLSSTQLVVTYDINKLSLQMIESALKEVGFILDNGMLQRIKRAIFAYSEDTERERLGINREDSVHQNALRLSEKQVHDPRPNDWRHYTE